MVSIDIIKHLSTALSSAVNKPQQHQEINSWECRESSPGLVVEKQECYLRAMQGQFLYQKVQGVCSGTPILSCAMKLSIVSRLIRLGENDMMAGSSLLTTWLGMASGIDRLLDDDDDVDDDDVIKFSAGDAIDTVNWKSFCRVKD